MEIIKVGDMFPTNGSGDIEVIKYDGSTRVTVRFVDTGYITTTQASNIRRGRLKDPKKPTVYGVGFMGEGKHKAKKEDKHTTAYKKWLQMLRRCYCPKTQEKYPTYIGCTVAEEWHNFQNFAEWFYSHSDTEGLELDKDKTVEGNKIYSPSTCCLITKEENTRIAKQKTYTMLSPTGEVVTFTNLKAFCREHGLLPASLYHTLKGKFSQHHGWRPLP